MAKKKQPEASAEVAVAGGTNRLPAKLGEGDYALFHVSPERVKSLIKSNIGNAGLSEFKLDQVKVPGTGVTTWSIETIRGEEETKELRGIIVAYKEPRAFWEDSFDSGGGDSAPDCSSADGITGVGNPGGACVTCEKAQFGTSIKPDGTLGRGQACGQKRSLFLLRGRSLIPLVVSLPPTSLKGVESYFLRLLGEAYEFFAVETVMKLVKDKNREGTVYSRVEFAVGRELTEEEINAVEAYAGSLEGIFDAHSEEAAAP